MTIGNHKQTVNPIPNPIPFGPPINKQNTRNPIVVKIDNVNIIMYLSHPQCNLIQLVKRLKRFNHMLI